MARLEGNGPYCPYSLTICLGFCHVGLYSEAKQPKLLSFRFSLNKRNHLSLVCFLANLDTKRNEFYCLCISEQSLN